MSISSTEIPIAILTINVQIRDDKLDPQAGLELGGGHHGGRGEIRGLHVQPAGGRTTEIIYYDLYLLL